MSTAHPTASLGMEFDAIAAVIVGGTSFEKGKGGLPGTLLGVLTIGMLRNGLNLVGVPSSVQVSCIGVLVLHVKTAHVYEPELELMASLTRDALRA